MAGERYAAEYKEFSRKYNIDFSISDHYDFEKEMKALSNFAFKADYKNEELNLYVDTLVAALSVKLEKISKISEGRLYGSADVSIGDFIDDFDKLMQAKFADEAKETETVNTHKPLEGVTYAAIANAVWKRVKHFDKPTPDVWADSIIEGNLTLEDIKKVVEPAKARLDGAYDETWGDSEKSDYFNIYMAKQALDKALEGRSFLWKVWPGNWGQWYRESQYSDQLKRDLLKYNLSNDGLDEEELKELTEKSMISGAKNKLQVFLKEKAAANKTAPEAIEELSDEKEILFDEKNLDEIEEMLDKKALDEDKKIEEMNKRAVEKVSVKKAPVKKPTNRIEVRKLFADKNLTQDIKDQFVDLMAKSTNTNANKSAKANAIHNSLGMMVSESWIDSQNMKAHAIKFFKAAYNAIKNETPGMSVAEKIVAAQKIADIMLNTYSPVASDPSLAQYGDNYGVKTMDNDNIKTFTGYEGNVDELMNDVKVDLGINKAKVQFVNGEFIEGAVGKADKVEEKKQNVPGLEVK